MIDPSGPSAAGGPLSETKLFVPRARPTFVPRPRLTERLRQGAGGKLTLVSASAGSGKTTLLSDWVGNLAAAGTAAAWVSLDGGDNDPTRFWSYVIAALGTARSEVGEDAAALLRSPQPAPIDWVLTVLTNELATIHDDVVLVLDDYHVIDAQPVHDSIAFLLEHLPRQVQLVIATRSDPPLPLAHLRGRGELAELRASDLRFTSDEAASFLNDVMGLGLTAADLDTLETRTEGWIVGLQLAALSMQDRDDAAGFIRTFAGDDRYIVDYLVQEVLQRQPAEIRTFLLQTSILDRLSGPLCDAVTAGTGSSRILEGLERGNLFVVPLDDKRHWFRYHRLFADVLGAHVQAEHPDDVPGLHQRASRWYERNGLPSEAIRHALAARDVERAADLLERGRRSLLTGSQGAFLGWLRQLPDEVVGSRPVLGVYYAVALLPDDLEAARARLRDVELALARPAGTDADQAPGRVADRVEPEEGVAPHAEMVVVDEAGYEGLTGMVAIVHAYLAGAADDTPGMARHARRARDLLPRGDHLWRGAAGSLVGLASWTSGDLEAAHDAFVEAGVLLGLANWTSGDLEAAHDPFVEAGGLLTGDGTRDVTVAFLLATIRTAQGRLREAIRIYEESLTWATGQATPPHATAELYVGLSELRREHDDLESAQRCLQQSRDLGPHAGLSENRYLWYVAMARIVEAQGNLDRAVTLLDEAQRRYVRSPNPDVRPVAAIKARVWVTQGRLTEVIDWTRARDLDVTDELSYLREFEHITLARVMLAQHLRDRDEDSIREVVALLERLEGAAAAGGRTGSVIEVLALRALAHKAQGDTSRALPLLERALTLARPEGWVRIFVDEGPAMRTLLRHAAAAGIAGSYTQRLLSAFDEPAQPTSVPLEAATSRLPDPLTAREVEILRLIAAAMRNQEIADHLVISLSTVKRHIANAYRKLGASHRTEAIVRANELHLL